MSCPEELKLACVRIRDRKLADRKRIGGVGRLTNKIMNTLQNY